MRRREKGCIFWSGFIKAQFKVPFLQICHFKVMKLSSWRMYIVKNGGDSCPEKAAWGFRTVVETNTRKRGYYMEILKVDNLCKKFGSGENEVWALKGVSFTVNKGEFVAIVGKSGSGKSTLLHILGGVDLPTSGEIYVDGAEIFQKNQEQLAIFRRRQVGLVYQFYNLIPVLNVEENMVMPLKLDGRKVNKEHLEELLEILDLKERRNHLPGQLSGGQQQRVSIGRALIHAPAIVLADEPTGNLDNQNSREVMELLKYSNRKYKQTLLLITHDENIALQADRLIRLEDGKIVSDEMLAPAKEV